MPTTQTERRSPSRSASSSRAKQSSSRRSGESRPRGEPRITARNLKGEDRKFLEQHAKLLSPSTLRAKWIHSTDEHQDRPGQTLATQSPEVIRGWAEDRGATPVTVRRRENERPRTLRFDFDQNGPSSRLEPISWDLWLETFRDRKLVFIFQEQKRDGSDSNFFRLDSPEREEG
jgi:hypothetical protein